MVNEAGNQSSDGINLAASVFTKDGERLGEVKEMRGPYFKVAAPMHPDYWLQLSFAVPDAKGQVVMQFNKDELHTYEVKDIDSDLEGDALNRTDASLLGESGTGTDVITAP